MLRVVFRLNRVFVIMWRDKLRSLTLIEVLVAVSISVLLLGVSIPMFSKNSKSQNLANEADAISAFYQRARNFAFHPDRVGVDGYEVVGENCVTNKCDQLVIYAVSGAVQDEVDALLTPNVTIEMPSGAGSIMFAVGDGKTNSASTETLKVYFKGNSGNYLLININKAGNVDVAQQT